VLDILDPANLQDMKAGALRTSQKFNLAEILPQYEELYRKLVQKNA
jgi:hypothetical protein